MTALAALLNAIEAESVGLPAAVWDAFLAYQGRATAAKALYVEGCPCEVIQDGIEFGVLYQNDRCASWAWAYSLAVAPDGTLFIAFWDSVSARTPCDAAIVRRLRKMAKELSK